MSIYTNINPFFNLIPVDLNNASAEFSNALIKVVDRIRNQMVLIKIDQMSNLISVLKSNTLIKDYKQCDVSYVSTVGLTKYQYKLLITKLRNDFEDALEQRKKELQAKKAESAPVKTKVTKTKKAEPIVEQSVYAFTMAGNYAAIVVRPSIEEHTNETLLKHIHQADVRFKAGLTAKFRKLGNVKTKAEINPLCKKHLSKFEVIYNARYVK